MIYLTLSSPASVVSHIGRSVEKQLKHLKILTVKDLFFYFPTRYDDLSKITPIKDVKVGERVVVRGRLELLESTRSKWRRKLLTHALVSDGTGSVRVLWFNQPWIAKMFKLGDELYLVGELKDEGSGAYLSSPAYERAGKKAATHAARIVPVYPSTERLSQKQLRFLVQRVLPLARSVPESLPEELRAQYRLVALGQALASVHFPRTLQEAEAARRRLKFDELLRLQLLAANLKRELKKLPAPAAVFNEKDTKKFVEGLPFKLTEAQRKAAWEIIRDLGRARPMNRLLEGDVGSGKTVVAAIAALNAARAGGQVAIMAPTEILARQHFNTFSKLLAPHGINIELRTASSKKKKNMVEADVAVGTHALIQKGVEFKNLVLAVVDEQHRFGVEQRAALKDKRSDGLMPHLLSLTATPIPRSLALVFYGDLDISILNEMPKGRQRIETILVEKGDRPHFSEFVRKEVAAGHQVFWTCPIIDPSDVLGVKAATEVFEHLRSEVFPDLRVGLLHGRMKSKARERVMQEFLGSPPRHSVRSEESHTLLQARGGIPRQARDDASRRIDILVATPVIEVGIDVPNATVMVIEGAERFGLAQLHQFRGRVGRGEAKSYCLLFLSASHPERSPQGGVEGSHTMQGVGSLHSARASVEMTNRRIQAFMESNDGFALAEKDLELRGPGEVYGTEQSGFPEFKIASFADVEIAKEAKEAAQWLLAQDPELTSYPQLREVIINKRKKVHLE